MSRIAVRKITRRIADTFGRDVLEASSPEELLEKIEEADEGQMIIFEEDSGE